MMNRALKYCHPPRSCTSLMPCLCAPPPGMVNFQKWMTFDFSVSSKIFMAVAPHIGTQWTKINQIWMICVILSNTQQHQILDKTEMSKIHPLLESEHTSPPGKKRWTKWNFLGWWTPTPYDNELPPTLGHTRSSSAKSILANLTTCTVGHSHYDLFSLRLQVCDYTCNYST